MAASVTGVYPARLSEPPVVGMSFVLTLSFSSTGIPWSGPTNFQGPRIEKDHHIELRARLIAGPDALQISLHQPYGCESAGLVRRVHIADRGFIEMKWFD